MASNTKTISGLNNASTVTVPSNGAYYAGSVPGISGSVLAASTLAGSAWITSSAMPQPTTGLNQSGVLSLRGDNADIDINGVSLTQTLQDIQDRLCMMRPNPELEQEWDALRELGEQYRELEAQLKEKSRMWKTLKKKD